MAADPSLPPITCPSSLVASCPPLLGFTPEESVVAFVLGVPDRSAPVLVRVDLPSSPARVLRWAREVAGSIAGTQGAVVDLVAWTRASDDTRAPVLTSASALDALAEALQDRGVEVAACLSTNGRVWWSHDAHAWCDGGSSPLDPYVVSQVQAEYVYAGFAPLTSRAALAALLEPDHRRADAVAARLAARTPPGNLERWRDGEIGYGSWLLVPGGPEGGGRARTGITDRLVGPPIPVRVAARVLRGLCDIPVRDTLLRRLVVCPDRDPQDWQRSIDLLVDVVRCAPPPHVAPAATLLALVAWMSGQGALATVALDRADAGASGYRLADLTRQVIARGIDPEQWRQSMAGVSEAECRGAQPSTRTSSAQPSEGSGA
jgi:hypothetical protein